MRFLIDVIDKFFIANIALEKGSMMITLNRITVEEKKLKCL